jgi:acetyl esterase/lipase
METGSSVLILPGGGYGHLAEHEGVGYAEWLNQHGITAFVVKYRLGSNGYRHPAMLHDAARAVRVVRANACEWGIDPARIGIMGSSAGGHLAATLLTHFDGGQPDAADPAERVSCRPDLGILCYPVITMGPATHEGSRRNLLGDEPTAELLEYLSNEKQVTRETPPCFIWHTWEDTAVKVDNAFLFAQSLQEQGVPFDLHIYQKGHHGVGLWQDAYAPGERHPWTRDCLYWLKEQSFL